MINNSLKCFTLILITLWISTLCGELLIAQPQNQTMVDSLINAFLHSNEPEKSELFHNSVQIVFSLDTASKRQYLSSLVDSTEKWQDEYHYNLLLFYSGVGNLNHTLEQLERAYDLMISQDNKGGAAFAELLKSDAYKKNFMYDSAMVSILNSKLHYTEAGHSDGLAHVLHKIADFHFSANYLDKAEEYYTQLLEIKGNIGAWNEWRHVVVNNNLGLIAEKRRNFQEAVSIFNNSREIIKNKPHEYNSDDTVRLGYIHRKLSELYLKMEQLENAISFYESAVKLTGKGDDAENMELNLLRAHIAIQMKDYNLALSFLNEASHLNQTVQNVIVTQEIYEGFANVYSELNQFEEANGYFTRYITLQDSTSKIQHDTRYMQIYAENNYNNYLAEIERQKIRNQFLIILLFTFISAAIVIQFLFIKKRRSEKMAVKKNVELIKAEQETIINRSRSQSLKNGNDRNGKQLQAISRQIKNLINHDKIYTDPDLNLEKLSKILDTNRTYLSRLINEEFAMNFSAYINEMRVKEAIRLFTKGEHNKFTIDTISKKVGFNNRTSFIEYFRKFTGVTPSKFIKDME